MYLGLNFLVRLRNGLSLNSALSTVRDSAKSAAFLGTFISLLWYATCLTRTRLGPLFYSDQLVLDNLGVKAGCLACGWSILVESAQRRAEIAFFVAPRALGAFLPRRYDRKVRLFPSLTALPLEERCRRN